MLEDYENNKGFKELKDDLNNFVKKKDKKIIIYLCKQCSSSILITNLYYDINKKKLYLECECQCRRIKYLPINDYYNEFEYEEYKQSDDIVKINNIKCFEHEGDKFEFYCIDCEKDLCNNCIEEIHPNHTFIYFNINIINQLFEKN